MAVTGAMVKDLRERTGAGMMDCKKALTEANGDFDKAIEVLREKGLAKAAKKAGRIAAEGVVVAVVEGKKALLLEVNSETDFAAKSPEFRSYAEAVAKQALNSSAATVEELMAEKSDLDPSKTVDEMHSAKIAIIGENLTIRRFVRVETEGVLASYIHGGGKIGVLVELDSDKDTEAIKEAGTNVAMQVAALNPTYLDRSEVSKEFLDKETEILKVEAKNENPDKPDNIIEKMVIGRVNKMLKEICLVDQVYVKDGDYTVAKYVDKVGKDEGTSLKVKSFLRFETGEGIEKKEENFAEEVAKQMQ